MGRCSLLCGAGGMILTAYRHALRVSELVSLKWDQIQFKEGLLHVRRLKNGTQSTHPDLLDSERRRMSQPSCGLACDKLRIG
jgi:integrase